MLEAESGIWPVSSFNIEIIGCLINSFDFFSTRYSVSIPLLNGKIYSNFKKEISKSRRESIQLQIIS